MKSARLVYPGLLVCAVFAWFFVNQAATRALLLVLMTLPLLSLALLYMGGKGCEARWEGPDRLTRGSEAQLALWLRRDSNLPCRLALTLEMKDSFTGAESAKETAVFFPGSGEKRIGLSLSGDHCGAPVFSVGSVYAVDFLGLFRRQLPLESKHRILVFPSRRTLHVELAETADFLQDSEAYSTHRPGYDPSETFRLREYQPGDPIRQIHWKLSEKTGVTLVRDFGLPIVSRLLVLFQGPARSLSDSEAGQMDLILDVLASVCENLCTQQIGFDLGFLDAAGLCLRHIDGEDAMGESLEALLGEALPTELSVCRAYGDRTARCAYAHVAVFGLGLPPDLDLLTHGNRVTALLPADAPFAEQRQGLGALIQPLHENLTELEL